MYIRNENRNVSNNLTERTPLHLTLARGGDAHCGFAATPICDSLHFEVGAVLNRLGPCPSLLVHDGTDPKLRESCCILCTDAHFGESWKLEEGESWKNSYCHKLNNE